MVLRIVKTTIASSTTKNNNAVIHIVLGFCLGCVLSNLIFFRNPLQYSSNSMTIKTPAETDIFREGPFHMPIISEKFSIFQPYYDMNDKHPQLFGNVQDFVNVFEQRLQSVNQMIDPNMLIKHGVLDGTQKVSQLQSYSKFQYLEMMKGLVSATAFNQAELSVRPASGASLQFQRFNQEKRDVGEDWTYVGDTMTGVKRLDNVRDLLKDVIQKNITGDYIETGVWRGGSSVFAKAVIAAYEGDDKSRKRRNSYVCDSFVGLPPNEKRKTWQYLEASSEIVANTFAKYGLLDSNVIFAKGFFNETMPLLSKKIYKLAIMRLDGDLYESTVDVLYHMYEKLSVNGYVIIDDWNGYPAKTACEDFFKVHGIKPNIIAIDRIAIYWQKTEEVNIQHWRYEQSKFKPGDFQTTQ